MKIVVKKPYKDPYIKEVNGTLEEYQSIVGGYIEVVLFKDDILLVCNEEGKLMELEPNLYLRGDIIVGTVFFIGRDKENFRGLTDEEIQEIMNLI